MTNRPADSFLGFFASVVGGVATAKSMLGHLNAAVTLTMGVLTILVTTFTLLGLPAFRRFVERISGRAKTAAQLRAERDDLASKMIELERDNRRLRRLLERRDDDDDDDREWDGPSPDHSQILK